MRIEAGELQDAARGLLAGAGAGGAEALWSAVVEAGWPALTAPEAQGGLEQTRAEAVVLYVELGRALSGAPLLPSLLATEALTACPPSPVRDGWLERVAGGEAVAASLCDPCAPGSSAPAERDGRLEGVARAVLGGGETLLVLAPGLVALLPLRQAGVRVEARSGWDETRTLVDVHLDQVSLSEVAVLARGAEAGPALDAASTHLHLALAADGVGAASATLEMTVDYLKTRRQFDRPLALFQALKHRCADLRAWTDAAQALVAEAALAAPTGARLAALEAKALAGATFRRVAEEAVQLHGGIGMTAEHPCHHYLKRALLNQQLGLPDAACERAVGAALLSELAA